ncbi:aminoglycoside/multidrug transporter subunit AcrD [Alcanivorax sp. HI0033]|uniref:efflux RND transporter permease subunit n=1 Tax=unclassified Alcanivorax TaxID=2638842 RepID=UPI0007B7D028|nr:MULTISPECIES: efflux RND transporter permease subunit [unclassified Alcanivorax]KZX74450.1 aminoglycoside/multidrug transporter subunit AcrD [Alcanivorax sp. HI0013]KZX78745.1 aminoglycoside/multidrug transporter subunit AcrD [Alcanivorax sp. HI0011]KZY18308.1 aminoglycoside/multidrug transporter subunit AcrD [Alcanivorax sp. HI0035]KZX63507.1 aminoglycoside/multidrug transporter subunit AcrD [Alcanivorax sp. HI0003]KZX66979.1 aminoglycoside/multidrug transporter subunit AcrD [Alcanivorax s
MARFFIDRPIFAWVIAIIMMMAGALAIYTLPVEQYPAVAPPAVTIAGNYPGASAKTVEDSVTQVIEQQMSGIDNLLYIGSSSDSFGNAQITLTFAPGTDADIAQVQVQNKLQLATPLLPQEVQQQGLQVSKSSDSFLMVVSFSSEDGSLTRADLADYVASNVQDPISRVPGVGKIQLFGSPYAMRIWLDPNQLNKYDLTPQDITQTIQVQNNQVASGQLGGAPAVEGQQLNANIIAQTRLQSTEQFENILLKVNPDGSQVFLRDVARVELAAQNYDVVGRYNGQPAAGLAISLASGANALDTADAVRARLEELKPFFPEKMEMDYPYDTTPFVEISIEEVVHTLFEAIILVFLVMYLFLQNFRATLIPTIAVPVVLLGTFGVLAAFGFSINTLTMFGMVLAIGLLVDDAIVVVENVERVMHEEGLPPKEATRKSMGQITGALVGIALVLSAVFIPIAFFPGSTGAIYRQFSITIVSAMVLSVLVALILTPALCATMLKAKDAEHQTDSGFFGWFNRTFDRSSKAYQGRVEKILGRRGRYLAIYVVIVGVLGYSFMRLPSSFLPEEDQGIMFTLVTLPAGSTQEQTVDVLKKMENYYLNEETSAVDGLFTVAGFSFTGQGQNAGLAFVNLKDWSERDLSVDGVDQVVGRSMGFFASIREAMIFALNPPSIPELGNASGFDFQLLDQAGRGHEALIQARNQLLGMASQDPRLAGVRPNGLEDSPQYQLDIDQQKAKALGLSISDINSTLQIAWGSSYVNNFVDRGRVKRVYVQADAPYRMLPENIDDWYVRNNQGEMVPFSAFATGHWTYGSPKLERYNGVSSVNIQGNAAPGYSTGDAMDAMEELTAKLPAGFGFEWTGLSYQERQSGDQAPALYALSLLVVFLCLAALYESWSIPFAVMLVVPLGVIGAVLAATFRGLENDVFFQVGLLTTIGLSAKNAILIAEFALELEQKGEHLVKATLEAVRMRLRPILMTSLAFMLGVTPLMISTGAGAGARNAIGTGVFGGMLTATVLAIFFIPLFYVVVRKLAGVPLNGKPKENAPH